MHGVAAAVSVQPAARNQGIQLFFGVFIRHAGEPFLQKFQAVAVPGQQCEQLCQLLALLRDPQAGIQLAVYLAQAHRPLLLLPGKGSVCQLALQLRYRPALASGGPGHQAQCQRMAQRIVQKQPFQCGPVLPA